MMPLFRLRGLRARVMLSFGLGALLVSATFAVLSYSVASGYLLNQRQDTVTRLAYSDANFVRDRLGTTGIRVPDVLTAVDPPEQTTIVIRIERRWYSSDSLSNDREELPQQLLQQVQAGNTSTMRIDVDGDPAFVVGIPLKGVDAAFFEVAVLEELQNTLQVLGIVLAAGALAAAIVGAGIGIWASRSVVRPLNEVAGTAAQIAAGQLDTRLAATRDPDLATIVGSFNSMVDTLQQRVERDARLAGDVSHELRSPLTTLVASVDVLNGRRGELSERGQRALDLVTDELHRFRRLLDNLLELARMDGGLESVNANLESVPLVELLSHTLERYGHSSQLLSGESDVLVSGNKVRLERVFANIFDNAERHADGIAAVAVRLEQDRALVLIDDDGPGVPLAERDHVFERFATVPAARGSSTGTGLGLTLVSETVAAHGGAVWCTDRPDGGGARFVVSLPRGTP